MADPRDDLAEEDLRNQYPGIPRITVRPLDVPAPALNDMAWGAPNAAGRPSGRLFEPDLDPAPVPSERGPVPGPNGPGSAEGGPQPPWQGGRLFEPDLSPAPVKPQWQPGILSLVPLARGIGNLVQGARDSFNAPVPPPLPPRQPVDPTAGPRQMFQQGYRGQPPSQPGLIGGLLGEALQAPQNMFSDINVERHPASTPEQVAQARRQLVGTAAETAMNVAGPGLVNAAVRPGASAGVFGGRLSKTYNPQMEKVADLMEKNGVPPQQIWKDTGMVKFADGKWAHEIPDIGASYKGDVDSIASRIFDQKYPELAGQYSQGVQTRNVIARNEALLKIQRGGLLLPDVIDHPQLFAAYPELRKMPVSQDAFMHAQGVYYPESIAGKDIQHRNIKYREETQPGKMARGRTLDTLLHEIQHAIQQIEGMAKGSSTHQMLSRIPGTGANKYYMEEIKLAPQPMDEKDFQKLYPNATIEDYSKYYDRNMQIRNKFLEDAEFNSAMKAYPESAGENVAELPGQRKNMTEEQLRGVFPPSQFRVPMDQQHVEFNRLINPAGTAAEPFGPPPAPPSLLPGYKPQAPPDFGQAQMGSVLGLEGPQMSTGPVLRGKAAEEAWRGIEKEPKLRTSVHPYSNVGGTPIREMESPIIKGTPKTPPRLLDIEKDLTNAEFIFTGGDAAATGGKLYGSKSMPFQDPVSRHGGPGYAESMKGKKIEGVPDASPVWASMKAPMGEIFNIASDVERRGKVPWQVYMTGGKQYLDSSLQMVDTAVQAARAKGVSDRANEYLFNVMRSDWNTAADPKRLFPETGLKNEKALREWIDNSPQPQRAKLVKAMDSVTARSLGFPDIGQLRVWNTDARMLTAPPGSAGLSMARLHPGVGRVPSHHPSYDTGIAGTDVGTLGMQVPHQIIAPTMHESRMSTLNKPQYYTAAPHLYFPGGGTKATKTEPVTNKLKDRLQQWMRDHPGGLAVAGTAGGLGSLVDPSKYEDR